MQSIVIIFLVLQSMFLSSIFVQFKSPQWKLSRYLINFLLDSLISNIFHVLLRYSGFLLHLFLLLKYPAVPNYFLFSSILSFVSLFLLFITNICTLLNEKIYSDDLTEDSVCKRISNLLLFLTNS